LEWKGKRLRVCHFGNFEFSEEKEEEEQRESIERKMVSELL